MKVSYCDEEAIGKVFKITTAGYNQPLALKINHRRPTASGRELNGTQIEAARKALIARAAEREKQAL